MSLAELLSAGKWGCRGRDFRHPRRDFRRPVRGARLGLLATPEVQVIRLPGGGAESGLRVTGLRLSWVPGPA